MSGYKTDSKRKSKRRKREREREFKIRGEGGKAMITLRIDEMKRKCIKDDSVKNAIGYDLGGKRGGKQE